MALCTNNLTYLLGEYNWGYCGEIQTAGVENVFLPAVCRKEYIFHYCSLKMPQGTNECLRFYCHSVLKEYYSYVEYSGQNTVSGKRSVIFVVLN